MELDKFDIEMLYALFISKKTSPLQSFSINDIIKNTELKSTYYTFVRRIQNKLIPNKFVCEGYKDGNAKTYYITKEGIDYLKENILSKEEVYEYVDVLVDLDD